jgi:hypothetical protein
MTRLRIQEHIYCDRIWTVFERNWSSYLDHIVAILLICMLLLTSNKKETEMNVVFIVPTGIGAEVGGHNGDATPAAKLVASLCDNFITHPNVVNASDINEMPDNTLYVEGNMLDRFLCGKIGLKKVKFNKVLVATNSPVKPEIINSVSAARASMGMDIEIVALDPPLILTGKIENNRAVGKVVGWEGLIKQVRKCKPFDALAISSPVFVDKETKMNYWKSGGVNPFGRAEALVSKLVGDALNVPVAHAPCEYVTKESDPEVFFFNQVVDPRMAAELVSVSYLHCVLKGLHKAPRPVEEGGLRVSDVNYLVSPVGCVGEPHHACMRRNIPIIMVKENKTCENKATPEGVTIVENYLEAAGMIACKNAGVYWKTVRRPLINTVVS